MWDVTKSRKICEGGYDISTHTSRVGCDFGFGGLHGASKISTHTSRVGCDAEQGNTYLITYISTHTSRVGCDRFLVIFFWISKISTHTSRVGCDRYVWNVSTENIEFLLTHPVWDVTQLQRIRMGF